MLRLGLLILIGAAAAVWVEPRWQPEERVLTLRLRVGDEIVGLLRERARDLGQRAIRAASEVTSPPPVGAGGPADSADTLTRADREALDRLIEEKIRENERGKTAGAN